MNNSFVGVLLACCSITAADVTRIVVYGDTRAGLEVHRQLLGQIGKEAPDLVLNSGDLWSDYGPANFRKIIRDVPHLGSLLETNRYLVARGNHEKEDDVLAFTPSIVRDRRLRYSFLVNNVFIVCAGLDPRHDLAWIERQFSSNQAQAARWRIVLSHYPVYSSGEHGAQGIADFESICDRYGVNLVFSGHDHHYERSFQLRSGVKNDAAGTAYIVTGGGGAPLRRVSGRWWSASSVSKHHYCRLIFDNERIDLAVIGTEGRMIDHAVYEKPLTADGSVLPVSGIGLQSDESTAGGDASGDANNTEEQLDSRDPGIVPVDGTCGTGVTVALFPLIVYLSAVQKKKRVQ